LSVTEVTFWGFQSCCKKPYNSGTWEVKAVQEDCEFEASPGYIVRPCLKNNKQPYSYTQDRTLGTLIFGTLPHGRKVNYTETTMLRRSSS
jgi:hypothetical protein